MFHWISQLFKNWYPQTLKNMKYLLPLLRNNQTIPITREFWNTFHHLENASDGGWDLVLTQPLIKKQMMLTSDAMFAANGYALRIEATL